MADNKALPATGAGTANIVVASRSVTYSGDANTDVQVVGLATFAGSDDAKTVADIGPTNPLPVATPIVRVSQTPTVSTSDRGLRLCSVMRGIPSFILKFFPKYSARERMRRNGLCLC